MVKQAWSHAVVRASGGAALGSISDPQALISSLFIRLMSIRFNYYCSSIEKTLKAKIRFQLMYESDSETKNSAAERWVVFVIVVPSGGGQQSLW